jgi:hypothetical protein
MVEINFNDLFLRTVLTKQESVRERIIPIRIEEREEAGAVTPPTGGVQQSGSAVQQPSPAVQQSGSAVNQLNKQGSIISSMASSTR